MIKPTIKEIRRAMEKYIENNARENMQILRLIDRNETIQALKKNETLHRRSPTRRKIKRKASTRRAKNTHVSLVAQTVARFNGWFYYTDVKRKMPNTSKYNIDWGLRTLVKRGQLICERTRKPGSNRLINRYRTASKPTQGEATHVQA